jgi:prophage antirepressor-like protein
VSQKAVFGEKKSRTVKKSKMYLLIAREREEISQKFQRIWIQHAKSILSE